MLSAAFYLLALAVVIGITLAILHLSRQEATAAPRPPAWLAGVHALIGIGGLGCLALSLSGPPRGEAQGTGSFGFIAAALIALAFLVALAMLAARLKGRRLSGTLIGIHATLAVGGFVVLMAYYFS
jgi:hypothetical protein